MNIYYKNDMGQILDLSGENYKMISTTTLFDYKWKYTKRQSYLPKVGLFSNEMVEMNVSIRVSGRTSDEYYGAIENLIEVFNRDIYSLTPGRLYVGNSYLKCYFISSTKPNKYMNVKNSCINFVVLAEDGNWIEESSESFGVITNLIFSDEGLGYPHEYPYDYSNSVTNRKLINNGYNPSDFLIRIYGSCDNPSISIGTNMYKINTSLLTGEYLEIDSLEQTITKHKNDGQKVNMFHYRDKESYIFEKIPSGANIVAWSGAFGFDITLFIKRSEPRWI